MADKLLPSINFDSNPGYNDFSFLHKTYSDEFIKRSLVSCNPGIVDLDGDPAFGPFGSRPLSVSVSVVDPLTVDVSAGFAITPSHQLINIDSNVPSVPFPEVVADKVYIVAVEYKLVASAEKTTSRFGRPVERRLERPTNEPFGGGASTLSQAITVASLTDFNNPSLFSEDRKSNLVVIAVVTVRSDPVTGQLSLIVDQTRNNYDFNRPWFSTVDIEHRSKIGSGVVTDTNPHGTQLQDLSSAGFTLYQQLLPRGGVYSKDLSYYGYPGTFCTELVTINRFQTDPVGNITKSAELEQSAGRFFVVLTKLPVRMGSLYPAGQPWNPIPYHWVPGTRYLVLGSLENPLQYGTSLVCEYFSVNALAAPQESLTQGVQTFTVGEPVADQEYIISGGQPLDSLGQTTLSLTSLLGPIKKGYQAVCTEEGALFTHPQPIIPVLGVNEIVGQPKVAINQAPLNGAAVTLTVGLTRATESLTLSSGFDLNLKLRINGLNENGAVIEEDMIFRASQWRDQGSSNEEEPLQFRTTKNKFSYINSITSLNTTSDPDNSGNEAQIALWANILEASANQELAKFASFFWTGTTAVRIRDERVIATGLQRPDQRQDRFPQLLPENDAAFMQEFFSVILDPPLTDPAKHSKRLALELDDDRFYSETWKSFSETDALGEINVLSFAFVTPGMTMKIAEDSVLTFVDYTPDPSVGEVQIPTHPSTGNIELKNNIIATINDPAFDSTWYAEATNLGLSLTRPKAFPEGFKICVRKNLVFDSPFNSGSVTLKINGTEITSAAAAAHADSMINLETAINFVSDTTKVSAKVLEGSQEYIILYGPANGQPFVVSDIEITGSSTVATTTVPSEPFSVAQPVGGSLPTDHLPNRFLSTQKKWFYLSRAIAWPKVSLRARISFTGNVATFISNLDMVEIVPGKTLLARRGDPAPSINRAVGEFLVTPDNLLSTLESMVETINDPTFNSGVKAELDGTTGVYLNIGGYATAQISLLVESVSGTWEIQEYAPVGIGTEGSTAFLKTVLPLETAEWRYQLVKPITDFPFGPGSWSPWEAMQAVSGTAFKFQAPENSSLYAIQVRLRGREGKPNSFSLYQLSPQVSSSTLEALGTLTTEIQDEIGEARGNLSTLNERISGILDADGNPIKDTELSSSRSSSIYSTFSTLQERLNFSDIVSYWLGSGNTSSVAPALGNLALANQITSGPLGSDGNSDFLFALGNDICTKSDVNSPLVIMLNGKCYRYARMVNVSFVPGVDPAGTYYIYAEETVGNEMGMVVSQGSTQAYTSAGVNVVSGNSDFSALSAMLTVQNTPAVIVFPSISYLGGPLFLPISAVVSSSQLQVSGMFPISIPAGTAYEVRSFREMTLTKSIAPKEESSTKIALGQVTWGGGAGSFANIVSYRYLDRYTSPISPELTAAPNYTYTFQHNLGKLPRAYTLYYHTAETGDAEPMIVTAEAVVKATPLTLTVKQRYDNVIVKDFSGTNKNTGYLQLII